MPKKTRPKAPEPVVGAYILDQRDRLLLIKSYKWGDQWLIPGGHIEYGESAFDTAVREVKEEVGLSVRPLGVVTVFEDIFPKDFFEKRHFLYIELFCRAKSTKVKIDGDEVSEYAWFSLGEALKVVSNPTITSTISAYLEIKKGRRSFIELRP
ncbi:MAG: NUDIX domain-containing protein [Candidatus Micrarchaeota archaeon]|nr:NUDIX domain-containing protein [Candidatus Micrarchaeota archaeon]